LVKFPSYYISYDSVQKSNVILFVDATRQAIIGEGSHWRERYYMLETSGLGQKCLDIALTIAIMYLFALSAKEYVNNKGDLDSVSISKNIYQYQHLWCNDNGKGK
jgi:hypothetical protein